MACARACGPTGICGASQHERTSNTFACSRVCVSITISDGQCACRMFRWRAITHDRAQRVSSCGWSCLCLMIYVGAGAHCLFCRIVQNRVRTACKLREGPHSTAFLFRQKVHPTLPVDQCAPTAHPQSMPPCRPALSLQRANMLHVWKVYGGRWDQPSAGRNASGRPRGGVRSASGVGGVAARGVVLLV